MKTNEAFPARETNPVDVAKLEGYKPKIAETSCAEVAGPDQPVVKQMRPGHFTNQIHPGFPGYPNHPPPPPPRWKHICSRTIDVHFSTLHTCNFV